MLLFGRRTNRVIEFACFDPKLEFNLHAIRSKVNKPSDANIYLPHAVSQNSFYLRFIRPTDNTRQTNLQQKTNFLDKVDLVKQTIK